MKEKLHYSLDELLNKRKSVRKFSKEPISTKNMLLLIKAARKAPSAGGIRPISIFWGDFKEERENIYFACSRQSVILNASSLIIFCADFKKIQKKYHGRGNRYAILEIGHMAQNVCLKAIDLGLVTCCVGAFKDNKIKEILNCDESPMYIVAIGYQK